MLKRRAATPASPSGLAGAQQCRRKFLLQFPGGFHDQTYLEWERDYKLQTHARWQQELPREAFRKLLAEGEFEEASSRAVRVEQRSRHAMLFSFEKMALRDALRSPQGAKDFSQGLYDYLHGRSAPERRFERWVETVASLPRRQTRVLTWPLITVFGFIAQPKRHMFLKPKTMRAAALAYGYDLQYQSRPSWGTYSSLMHFVGLVEQDLADLAPRDMIDLQSFLWVQGSDEY